MHLYQAQILGKALGGLAGGGRVRPGLRSGLAGIALFLDGPCAM